MPKLAGFQPDVRRRPLPDLIVREAAAGDAAAIAALVVERDGQDPAAALAGATGELAFIAGEGAGRRALFVAEHEAAVIGFGRAAWRTYAAEGSRGLPDGWYLTGVIVAPEWRRRGVGRALTERRIAWIAERSDRVFYFTSVENLVSVAMHEALGFREHARDVAAAGVTFVGGVGVCFVKDGAGGDAGPTGDTT